MTVSIEKAALKAYADRAGVPYHAVVLQDAQKDPALQKLPLAVLAEVRNQLVADVAQEQLRAGRAAQQTVGAPASGSHGARAASPMIAQFGTTPAAPAGRYASLSETIARGTPAELVIGSERIRGAIEGFDYKGRPVVRDQDGERRTGSWDKTRVFASPSGPQPIVGLKTEPMPAKLEAALQAAIDIDVCGKHTSREYIEQFANAGYRVFIVGGALRDALAVLEKNPNASSAAIVATLKDVDIVTTAPTPVVRKLCADVAPELRNAGIHSPDVVDQYGTVLIGGPKAGLSNAEGLDIASLRSSGIGGDQRFDRDIRENVVPFTFDHNIEEDAFARDFSCNSLYAAYDPATKTFALVDPTGTGIDDAKKSFLRPNLVHVMKSDIVSLRFFKFRMRGFTSDATNTAAMKRHAEHFFAKGEGRLANMVLRIAPKDVKDASGLRVFLKELRATMAKDGCEGLFVKYIAPLEQKMAAKLANRYGST